MIDVAIFQKTICEYYRKERRSFPWRETDDPYKILVSEIMLQQTQTDRVLKKYDRFVHVFPHFQSLAEAPLIDVMRQWQGLGYNRRALALKRASEIVISQFNGKLPSDVKLLKTLPGIGYATASAICAFAFNQPMVFVETNIRTVFIHFFFQDKEMIYDNEILPLVQKTLNLEHPRQWYYALMDYGAWLKKSYLNPSRKSFAYRKQPPFPASNRYIRGQIVKLLVRDSFISNHTLVGKLKVGKKRINENLHALQKEGFIRKEGDKIVMME